MQDLFQRAEADLRIGRIGRREFMALALAGGATLATATAAANRVLADTPKRGGHAVFGLGGASSTDSVDPNVTPGDYIIVIQRNVFNSLTEIAPDGSIIGELAESWDSSPDAKRWQFKLRKGVTFHNGEPFTAADVKATFEYASGPDRPAQWYPGRVTVDVVDDHTANVNTKAHGYPASLFWFLSAFLPIMSAKDVANPATLAQRPNGTGAFKFVRQDGNTSVLEANPDFVLGAPKVPGVNFTFVGDATTRMLSLLSGEADIIERLEAEQVETIEARGGFSLNKAVSVENKYLWFRCSKPPFNDWRLRRAVAHSIDRDIILEVLGVSGTPSNAFISPVKFGYVDTPNYPKYDPELAQKFLAEAGFPGGRGLPKLEYITSVGFYPKTKEYGEVITALLQEQGFDIEFSAMEVAAWADRLYDRPGGGPGHMIDCGWATGSPEPDLVLRTHFHSSSKRITGIEDPELDALLDKERNATDPAVRKKIIQEELMPALADKVPAFSLFTSARSSAAAS